MEWLTATAEDPRTRGEATSELYVAIVGLDQFAKKVGTAPAVAAQELLAIVDRFRAEGWRARA